VFSAFKRKYSRFHYHLYRSRKSPHVYLAVIERARIATGMRCQRCVHTVALPHKKKGGDRS